MAVLLKVTFPSFLTENLSVPDESNLKRKADVDELEEDMSKLSPVPLLIRLRRFAVVELPVIVNGTPKDISVEDKLNFCEVKFIIDEPDEKDIVPTEVIETWAPDVMVTPAFPRTLTVEAVD